MASLDLGSSDLIPESVGAASPNRFAGQLPEEHLVVAREYALVMKPMIGGNFSDGFVASTAIQQNGSRPAQALFTDVLDRSNAQNREERGLECAGADSGGPCDIAHSEIIREARVDVLTRNSDVLAAVQ